MAKQIRRVAAAALTLALQAGAIAQTTTPLPTTAPQDVLRLAPQLVPFAGSDLNFQNLVNGLSQGVPVTLTTLTADGFLQTVTFTPASAMSSTDIARTLETARQQLIAHGVANPTAQQIGVTLAGGNLPTASGTTQMSGLVTTVAPGGFQPSAFDGASLGASRAPSAVPGTVNPGSNLVVDIRPATPQAASASTGMSTGTSTTTSASPQPATGSPVVRFTSDSGRTSNTSDTPAPSAPPPSIPPVSSPGNAGNGGPSPAAQMQGRK